MDKTDGFMKALKCRECGREYPLAATHVCDFDFGPLEVVYDYERIRQTLTRTAILGRPQTMWRYRELLPIQQYDEQDVAPPLKNYWGYNSAAFFAPHRG